MKPTFLALSAVLLPLLVGGSAGCGSSPDADVQTDDPDEVVGANSVARTATVKSYVLVRVGASDSEISRLISQQIKPLFGATKAQGIGLGDRDANNIDASTWVKDTVDVIDPAKPATPVQQMQRVRFTYKDRVVVVKSLRYRRAIPTTSLFGDYFSHSSPIVEACQSEHKDWGSSGIWYNFEPELPACKKLITDEKTKIDAQRRTLTNADRQVTVDELNRWFTPITLSLTTIATTETKYPDYHRMYDDGKVVVGAFFGVDKLDDPNDYGAKNFFTYLRTVMNGRAELKLTSLSPTTDVTDVSWKGSKIADVTPQKVFGWILDNTGYPASVTFSDRNEFRKQIIAQWRDKTVTLSASGNVTIRGQSKPVTIEVRVFYGNEEGFGTGAVQRYKTAFQQVDVFQYTGHSHLGSGPLDARNYGPTDFPDRYQILMVNSCVSFNYYNEFFAMHPGSTLNLDTVTNGLPVFLEGSGLSSAKFALGIIDGQFRSYLDILTSMKVDLPWEPGHDANRVADGETDNTFTPTSTPMTLSLTK